MTANYFNRGRGGGVQVTENDQMEEEPRKLVWLLVALMFLIRHLIWAYDVTGSVR